MSEDLPGGLSGEHVEFEVVKDAWQVLRLIDGTELRLKLVVIDVLRIQPAPPNEFSYGIKAQLMVVPERTKTEGAALSKGGGSQ